MVKELGSKQVPDQVEERLTFLSEGTTPRKNLEVMQEAIKEALELAVGGPDLGKSGNEHCQFRQLFQILSREV